MRAFALLSVAALAACSETQAPLSDDPVTALRVVETLSHDDMQGREAGTPGAAMARDYILSELAKIECLDVITQPFAFGIKDQQGYNIVASHTPKDGQGPLLIVSAHYDHVGVREDGEIFNGADDNASGVGAVITMAERACDMPRKNDVRYVFYDAEEKGLTGARRYVKAENNFEERPVFNLNLDMVSQNVEGEIYASGTRQHPEVKTVLETVPTPEGVTLRFGYDDPTDPPNDWTMMSDQAAFLENDLPFLYLGVEDHAHYHKVSDEYDVLPKATYLKFVDFIADVELALDAELKQIASAAPE